MKLRVFESISVDGYFTDPQGDIAWAHSGREDATVRSLDCRQREQGRDLAPSAPHGA